MNEITRTLLKIKTYIKIFSLKFIKFLGDIIPFLNRLTVKLNDKIDKLKEFINNISKKI